MVRMHPELAKKYLGIQKDGKLSPCPQSPNCVCSEHTSNTQHHLQAISFQGKADAARDKLLAVMRTFPTATLVTDEARYLRVEFKSRVFGFVDDVEFLIKPEETCIHFRSASRLGYWDIGINKKRMLEIKKKFESA